MGVAFVAHCLLNQNSKVGDGAHCAGIYSPVVDVLRDKGWRIEQMPCPELAFTGLHRFWAVREQLDTPEYRRYCRELASGEGIFVEELRAELARRGIVPGLGGETHALPDHDEMTQRAQLESLL